MGHGFGVARQRRQLVGFGFLTLALGGRVSAQTPSGAAQLTSASALPRPWSDASGDRRRGQNFALRVTNSMGTLGTALAALLKEQLQLKTKLGKETVEHEQRTASKERLMAEFRNGFFCSGCMQTKSQILAKGEQFPHPGQRVVAPTQAQIDKKDKELQRPIDTLAASIARAKPRLDDLAGRVAVGKEQLAAGASLWRTSHTYWRLAYERGRMEQEAALRQRVVDTERAAQQSAETPPSESSTAAKQEEERAFWAQLIEKQQAALTDFTDQYMEELAEINRTRLSQQRTLLDILARDPLNKEVSVTVVSQPASRGQRPSLLGEPYRMGSIVAPPPGAVGLPVLTPLADVAAFVADFKAYRGVLAEESQPLSLPPTAPSSRPIIDPRLLDLP